MKIIIMSMVLFVGECIRIVFCGYPSLTESLMMVIPMMLYLTWYVARNWSKLND